MLVSFRRLAVVVVVAGSALQPLTAYAAPAPRTITTHESGCTEEAFGRSLVRAAVEPLVPDGFELTPAFTPDPADPRVAGFMNVVTCSQVTIAGPGRSSVTQQDTHSLIYTATLLDGTPCLLLFATDSPVLAARYRQLGLPVQLLGRDTTSRTTTGSEGSARYVWSLEGSGWDGTVDGSVPTTLAPVEASTYELVHQTGDTVVHVCYDNVASSTANTVRFDFTNTPVAALAAVPVLPPGVEFFGNYVRGSWTATASADTCAS